MHAVATRQARLAGMVADLKARGYKPLTMAESLRRSRLHNGSNVHRMQEVMTKDDGATGLEYPRRAQEEGQRARILRLMDTYYPEDAPHYWRDYDLTFFHTKPAANEPTPPEVFAPVPLMAQIREMAAMPDGSQVLKTARIEPKGMRQSAILAILVATATVVVAIGRAKGIF